MIVHVTPGILDIRSFTVLGLHAKPNTDSPIGKFGSGLKYAIATLLRLNCNVRIFIDKVEYEFYTKSDDFRGVGYNQVMMRKRNNLFSRWTYTPLPFTTEFGRFWKAWQAFREIESNTRDEGGTTGVYDNYEPEANTTVIMVSGKEYIEAYYDRDKVFLPGALTKREGDGTVEVFNEPSDHVYWRGIRVFDLDKPSIYTYNILSDIELTEDRTIKYHFQAQQHIAGYIARSKDTKLISTVVSASSDKFEGKLDFDYAYGSPSAEFTDVIAKKQSRGGYIGSSSLSYYKKYNTVPAPTQMKVKDAIREWAYNTDIPEELQTILKHLLRCEIQEPTTPDDTSDGMPF